jgi:hypothetical protein
MRHDRCMTVSLPDAVKKLLDAPTYVVVTTLAAEPPEAVRVVCRLTPRRVLGQ